MALRYFWGLMCGTSIFGALAIGCGTESPPVAAAHALTVDTTGTPAPFGNSISEDLSCDGDVSAEEPPGDDNSCPEG